MYGGYLSEGRNVWNEESEKVYIENTDNKIKIFKNHSRVTNSES